MNQPNAMNRSALPDKQLLFRSFFMGGYECSTHRLKSGRRLDMVHATRHDRFCLLDYQRLADQGLCVAREGLRWHLIEAKPGVFDFSTAQPMIDAANRTGVQVLWDFFHYGWPEFHDIFQPEFIGAFRKFAKAAGRWLVNNSDGPWFVAPINEISFFSWATGHSGYMYPHQRHRDGELKAQLIRCAVGAMEELLSITTRVRFLQIDPIIHVVARPGRIRDRPAAERRRLSQFQAWNMLGGLEAPELGGRRRFLDIIGVNFYPKNQWLHPEIAIDRDHPLYRPLRELLADVYSRYQRPIFISETGCEDDARGSWLEYVCTEVRAAMAAGIPIHGICLYPIVNHPGWNDYRHCHNGLWDYADENGHREIYQPLADELQRWRAEFEKPEPAALAAAQPAEVAHDSRYHSATS